MAEDFMCCYSWFMRLSF